MGTSRSKRHRPAIRPYPIALVMIVRDEESRLGRCLESIHGLVDEIVVVDTGSIDSTAAIAESYGAKVGHFTWIDDFAAARNHALGLATSPWRLVLDADEWVANPVEASLALARLRTMRPEFIGQIGMQQVDAQSGELQDTVPVRIPRLLPASVEYVGRVHEQPSQGLPLRDTGLLLGHDGYSDEAKARKDGRNIALLEAALAEVPDEPYYWFQLGADHYSRQRYAEALEPLIRSYNLLHPVAGAPRPWKLKPWWHLVTLKLMLTLQALGDYEQAVALGEQEAETWINSSEFYCIFGASIWSLAKSVKDQDPARAKDLRVAAIGCLIHAVDQGDHPDFTGSLASRGTVLAAKELVDIFEQLNRPAEAEKYRAVAAQHR